MTKPMRLFQVAAKSPILWGGLASAAFYWLIHTGVLSGQFVHRYFASHPVEYIETAMFFIGLALLARKLIETVAQRPILSRPVLGPVTSSGNVAADCDAMLARLAKLPDRQQNDYFIHRLRKAVAQIRHRGSAESLDEHLQYLADLDAERQHAGFALLRIITSAIPILGFLGTVIGITLALANLAPQALEDSLPLVMQGVALAFDTTTLALSLSIVLMFSQFYVDRRETALLDEVDDRVAAELEGRFERIPAGPEGQLTAVRRMAENVLRANEQLVRRQADLWEASMEAAATRWSHMADSAGRQLQQALGGALAEGLKNHGRQLAAAEGTIAEESRRHLEQVRQSQTENVKALATLQSAMVSQAQMLARAVEAAGEVARLEDVLNRNLGTLAGARHFEQTVMGLAATIHLLNARLTEDPSGAGPVKLEPTRAGTKAA